MKIAYDLQNISEKEFFCDMITYISEYVEKTEVSEDKSVIYIYCDDVYEEQVKKGIEQLEDMVAKKLIGNESKMDINTIEDYSDRDTICTEDVFEKMVDKGIIYQLSDGAYAYSDIFLKVYKYFEYKIEEYGFNSFKKYGISEQSVPVLFSVDGYEEGGYFETFPHYIMFESVLKNNIDVLNDFSENGLNEGRIFNNMKNPDSVLRTATCAPIYKYLQNQVIEPGNVKAYLMSGRCFRNEGANVKTLARLNEFYMKEYVFVGSAKDVDECMKEAKKIWKYWIDVFNLNCKIETANDSFFANNYKKLKIFQILGQSKQEFKLLIPFDSTYISCGSANYHRTHFTKRYHICDGNKKKLANSVCFAFGIDRFTFALLSQKGIDIDKWDTKTINEISKYVRL